MRLAASHFQSGSGGTKLTMLGEGETGGGFSDSLSTPRGRVHKTQSAETRRQQIKVKSAQILTTKV